ncbi:MAG: aldo/keto reductase [Rhodospirillaceae bacterium]|jgi:aryl-alcohol dehydrogenase-like predicted oxidoreductase|nr:aldo/keto reductase [Rhodospirillaceae bacterium]MBT5239192.1 aldo/keto reductase [Rhodospirillaceae bacterium]MBT5566801.1 aldo/keto reductase [Rhodospirillaceae bacterium]MBT6089486.1 aldo/keto reductase [Rhodospirillaceae bacterium]MBT6961223.1 aldo/keto reductase [Rhodospirillaceae bacterium]
MKTTPLTRRSFTALSVSATAASALSVIKPTGAATTMLTRPIPSSGEQLPVIGLGTSSSFIVDRSDTAAMDQRKAVIQTLLDQGGSIIDTAPSYRGSEGVVGDLVKDLGVGDQAFLATKVRKEGETEGLEELNASFDLLHNDSIDLIQVHNLVDTDRKLGTMREWRQAGRYRYIGITHWRPGAQDALVPVMENEKVDFVQFQYNIEERSAEDSILRVAADRGIATMINVPFGRGRLFKQTEGKEIPEWAAEFAESWGQFYLKFILSHPAVTCIIPATNKPHHMVDNAGAGRGRLPDAKERQRMIDYVESI